MCVGWLVYAYAGIQKTADKTDCHTVCGILLYSTVCGISIVYIMLVDLSSSCMLSLHYLLPREACLAHATMYHVGYVSYRCCVEFNHPDCEFWHSRLDTLLTSVKTYNYHRFEMWWHVIQGLHMRELVRSAGVIAVGSIKCVAYTSIDIESKPFLAHGYFQRHERSHFTTISIFSVICKNLTLCYIHEVCR